MSAFGTRKMLASSFDEALAQLPAALAGEGFGVLTEVDVQQTLDNKLGVAFRRYRILGACNPPLAHQALQADLDAGLMMPCNVVVYEQDDGTAAVAAVDPTATVAGSGNPKLVELAAAIKDKLGRVLDQLR